MGGCNFVELCAPSESPPDLPVRISEIQIMREIFPPPAFFSIPVAYPTVYTLSVGLGNSP